VDGKTLRSGSGAPGAGLGVDGDFYIDIAADTIYGPKTAGAWGSPTSIVGPEGAEGQVGPAGQDSTVPGPEGPEGPEGPQGIQGIPGNPGADGDDGAPGADGATGAPGIVWSNMPSGTAIWLNSGTTLTNDSTQRADLTDRTECRLSFALQIAGSGATTQLRVQYSLDGATNWTDLVTVSALNVTGLKASAWTALPAGAQADVFLRLVGQNGNATADPRFSPIVLEVR
jgi:hypothetical protein